jgi:hypothetical protein
VAAGTTEPADAHRIPCPSPRGAPSGSRHAAVGVPDFFVSAQTPQAPAVLGQPLDWAALLHLARTHGVLPLLSRSLHTIGPDMVPQDARAALQHAFQANTQRNLFLAGTLLKLLRLLEAYGIAAIPYRGPVLATLAYGNVALRQFGDLDLLVRPQDADRARALLWAQGYRWRDGHPPARFPRLLKVYELLSADAQVLVELHWALTSATFFFPLNPASLWTRLETVSLLGTPVRSLAPEDLLLILCVHGAKHFWSRLGWICDVAAVLRVAPQLDWERCLAQASRLGGKRMLALGPAPGPVPAGRRAPYGGVALDTDNDCGSLARSAGAIRTVCGDSAPTRSLGPSSLLSGATGAGAGSATLRAVPGVPHGAPRRPEASAGAGPASSGVTRWRVSTARTRRINAGGDTYSQWDGRRVKARERGRLRRCLAASAQRSGIVWILGKQKAVRRSTLQ